MGKTHLAQNGLYKALILEGGGLLPQEGEKFNTD